MYYGYIPSTPIETQLQNLAAQIPQEYRARVMAEAMSENGNPYDTKRALIGLVIGRIWETYEHAVELAQDVEREIDWQISAEHDHAEWIDHYRTQEDARY